MAERRTIQVEQIARVEGEGALRVQLEGDRVTELEFRIFEAPRFFEALLQGRDYREAPDITARICGICPVAYLLGASQAMEAVLELAVPPGIHALRRLIYCGEWIQSHLLHVFFLHAPDFLGYDDAIAMAADHPQLVRDAMALKATGNRLLEVIGGRAVHPVNLQVGGFHRAPTAEALAGLVPELEQGLEKARELARVVAGFDFPQVEQEYLCVSLHHPQEYAITRGRLVSSEGLDIPVDQFEAHFEERQVPRSNALHACLVGREEPYLVGPMARYNNNFEQLSPSARELARECGLPRRVHNPFHSIVVRMVEVAYAFEEALRLARDYRPPEPAVVTARPKAGRGAGCTEAPRGICYHRYDLDGTGRIQAARIVPPTSQNQRQMEADLKRVVERHLSLPDDQLQWRCEQAIRNFDPCISCATHFLKLTLARG
jgi:coenzyme F420-reducing hydrogenase alpha subunit